MPLTAIAHQDQVQLWRSSPYSIRVKGHGYFYRMLMRLDPQHGIQSGRRILRDMKYREWACDYE